jgi:hypothetical protein
MSTLFALVMATALANGPVLESGACSGNSDWWMEAIGRPANRVEIEFEVESGVAGQTWDVEVYRNGRLIGRAVRTSRGADGDFWVEREVRDVAGVDAFVAVAINRTTGEICEGELDW